MKISNSSNIPSSVYRLQLNENFLLKDAIEILPYLKNLGIEGVYTSPYYDSYSYGYDVTNPNRLNPKLGTMEEYNTFCARAKKLGLKHIIDVVPNHMGIKGGKNQWWQDVLENGPYSTFSSFFDINWSPEKREMQDKVLLPILGENYGKTLEQQKIALTHDEGVFTLYYLDFALPVSPQTYAVILDTAIDRLKKKISPLQFKEYQGLIELYRLFPVVSEERKRKKKEGEKRFRSLLQKSAAIRGHIADVVALFNGRKKDPASFDHLDRLLESQFYRLTYWKVATHEINYRRFFNINELVAIRIEDERVLETHHKWLFHLIKTKKVQGMRIDHPDGLYDPDGYFATLRKRFPLYTVVEKILDRREKLPETWQVEGTEGYEYLNLLTGLFISKENEEKLSEIYDDFTNLKLDFSDILYAAKKYFAFSEMASEVESLSLKIDRLSENIRYYRDFTHADLTYAISEIIACFPVYRTYIHPHGRAHKNDAHTISIAVARAKQKAPQLDVSIFDFLEKVLLSRLRVKKEQIEGFRELALRFQQLSAPVMAKGLEDTTFYIYNRFIALNEVGGDPTYFGRSATDFHTFNLEKRKKWPFGFLATSTHDTKRSEDARMRLSVLSEMPDRWEREVKKWERLNRRFKKSGPSSNFEYFLYQTLLAVWPRHQIKKKKWHPFFNRLWAVALKSMREAKLETSWALPNIEYEESVREFLLSILSPEKGNQFLKHFIRFQNEIDRFGAFNSLSSIALKIASCGVPTLYQGNEIWNYSLVDPDNRRAVDYSLRKKMLNEIRHADPEKLFLSHDQGKIKLYLHWKALQFRKQHKKLFLEGEYIPLQVRGSKKEHLIAFMRKFGNERLIVITGRFFATLLDESWAYPVNAIWKGVEVVLPPSERNIKEWKEVFTSKFIHSRRHNNSSQILASEVFSQLPFCYLFAR